MNEGPTGSQLASTSESKPVGQLQQGVITPTAIMDSTTQSRPNLPSQDLINGRDDYIRYCSPLLEAAIKSDWKVAKHLINKKPELLRSSITPLGDTALHIAVGVKRSKHAEKFVTKLVDMMDKEDLELQNEGFNTALYIAAAIGDINAVKLMVEKNRILTTIPGAGGDLMPLYAAAFFGSFEVVKYLYENSNDLCDDGWNSENRGWLLERCVEADMFDVALKIVKKYPKLGNGEILGALARKPNAFRKTKSNIIQSSINSVFALIGVSGYEKESEALQLVRIIWEGILKRPEEEIEDILRGPPDPENLSQTLPLQKFFYEHRGKLYKGAENITEGFKCVSVFDKALRLHNLISKHLDSVHAETEKQDNGEQNLELRKLISEHIVNTRDEVQNIIVHVSGQENKVIYLTDLILKYITKMEVLLELERIQYSSRLIFVAAEIGNTKFLSELIRQYPDLIWKTNDDGQTIFHIAVKHRQESIYNLLYETGSMKNFITCQRDMHDNNMLHLAGMGASKERLTDVSGAALQMQRELLWFKEVRDTIPPSYREQKNKDGLTPRELFTKEHRELMKEGEKWMKGTASQCMVVATLIATIVFAAAFTIPGGYNQTNGIPVFYQKPIFVAFVVADAMSLLLSSTSILTFLSILTSRYAERDFVESLPKKLMLGISTLFLSITAMMITFGISFFILYHKEMKWIPILIGVLAIVPVVLYVALQYHVILDVIRSTYGSKYLFRPGRQFIYYANPHV
ncbi:putative ankyrin repeat-containing domain, PGG domain, ankyrin repeat-containing domain superfamily [Helianthus annuus]|uniref:Ankyrin repeat-containing domain, PGG domain, ankyrin repeat-containing domain superfamily n=3 Tax=Helianthus annuus TaxID=4232 RepID=A0A9K3H6A3_HELAN|nr:putative ankyrin repeat-containing domain, PGG domain, ankyrin repeat-containing domain superfamily [Helianthus annuus]KAJ0840369.1 putative ankyrin repeat-containing domain, PGG domain, ankyrin repeat-containing domain superfamily [Helianthus annuus]KAJ0853739.1 putative ankyrin repeat-containing domain, PGG domain, ankyrin repeat-containing domain superfamily [Helianthus annuus]